MWVFNNNPRVSKGCEVLKVGCLKHPYRGVPGVWVFNNNTRVSIGCEVLKVGCLKHPYRGVPGVWVLDIKICGRHYLE